MDEVVNRLGFSGIVSLLSLQTRFVFTCKPCRRLIACLCVFITLLCASEIYGLVPAEILLATDVELNSYVG